MQDGPIATIFLPVALGIIMLGLGLSLTIDDFKRVVRYPKAVAIGLVAQMVILPAVCLGIAHLFGLTKELGVGLMLLAASPGGATANLYSHLAKGDVALNITLTAINSVLSLATMPLIVGFALQHFMGDAQTIPLQVGKVLSVIAVILVPVTIGMIIRAKKPETATKLEKPVRLASAIVLLIVIGVAVASEIDTIADRFAQVGLACLTFNLASMAVGYFLPLLFRVERKQAIAIGMEIAIHNGTLAIAIALTVLKSSDMSTPPAIYSIIMFFTAAAFGYAVSRRRV